MDPIPQIFRIRIIFRGYLDDLEMVFKAFLDD